MLDSWQSLALSVMGRPSSIPLMAAAFSASLFLYVSPSPVRAQQSQECRLAIARAGEAISNINAVISDVVTGTNESPNNPFSANGSITFRLGSYSATRLAQKKSEDLMNSPRIQATLAKSIFDSCPDIVEVRFNMTATDWDSSLFRGANGSIIKGTCIDPGSGEWPLWGYYKCL